MEDDIEYKRAYVEVLEIFKHIPEEQKSKIPQLIIQNMEDRKDKEYIFQIDETKKIDEQNLSVVAQALLIEIYRTYLSTAKDEDFWKKYDNYCKNKGRNDS